MSYEDLVHRVMQGDWSPSAAALESVYFDLWSALFVTQQSSSAEPWDLTAQPDEVTKAADVLLTQALKSDLDAAPLLNSGTLLRSAGQLLAAEIMLAIAAFQLERESLTDPSDRVEADNAWVQASEVALQNGHVLSAAELASRCSNSADREQLLARIRESSP